MAFGVAGGTASGATEAFDGAGSCGGSNCFILFLILILLVIGFGFFFI